jgi:hypothetical protein
LTRFSLARESREAIKFLTRIPKSYDTVTVYDIETVNQQETETKAIELYKKEKNTWLGPRLVETIDEYEVENEPDRA